MHEVCIREEVGLMGVCSLTSAGDLDPRLGGGEEEVGGGHPESCGENKTRSGGQDDRDAEGEGCGYDVTPMCGTP